MWHFELKVIILQSETRKGARVAEEARLESVYTPKGYHEFESRSLRWNRVSRRVLVACTIFTLCSHSFGIDET